MIKEFTLNSQLKVAGSGYIGGCLGDIKKGLKTVFLAEILFPELPCILAATRYRKRKYNIT
jgi:hypothetical protein